MAKTNSTPKGTAANRTGANQKKQKIIEQKKKETRTLQQRQNRHALNKPAQKNAKVPTAQKVELSQEDIINNIFEGMAVSIAYAKNDAEKQKAVDTFVSAFSKIPEEQKEAIKAMIIERLKEDDFIYGSEFIDLKAVRQYQDDLFKTPQISLEDRVNNEFEEMAVSVHYGKNEGEKLKAVRSFNTFINNNVKPEELDKIKEIIADRLKEDDFIYGSEFIDLTALRQYQDKFFEKRKVAKEFEPHTSTLENKQQKKQQVIAGVLPPEPQVIHYNQEEDKNKKPLKRPNPDRKHEQDLYQALVDGINNEEIKNIKGYSKDDLKKILDYHEKLLYSNDGNGTAFESLYENSISDLKKFANGDMTVDNDSYETMLQFIKTFGTNSKGELTPEGKAAYDKLMGLMAEAQKEKIRKNKEQYQQHAGVVNDVKDHANNTIGAILGGLAENAKKREKNQPEDDFVIGVEDNTPANTNTQTNDQNNGGNGGGILPGNGGNTPPAPNGNGGNGGSGGDTPPAGHQGGDKPDNNNATVYPPVNLPDSAVQKDKEKKKGLWGRIKDWGKRNWKKVVAAAAIIGGLLLLKNCNGDGKPVVNGGGNNDGNGNKPDTTIVTKPDTIALEQSDLGNGFYLERSAGFKGEQKKLNFKDAEKANKVDLLTIKKLVAHQDLDMNKFVRHDAENKEPVTVSEIAYKMRIVTQNFPKSKMAQSVENMFAGKISDRDRNNIYAAFNHIDDFGNLINGKGQIIEGIPGKKEIDSDRMGPGSKEYGTEGASVNFVQVLKNHRDSHNK